jgi:hypothetical protein
VTFSYFHRRYHDLTAVVNVALGPGDYTALEVANPLDGTPLTIYNQSAATIGRVDNLLVNSDALTQEYDGAEVTFNRRLTKGASLFGGITVGSNKAATSASTNPNDRLNAAGYDLLDSRVILNVSGVYQLPWKFDVSSHLAYYTGQPLRRIYTVTRTVVPELRQASQDVLLLPTGDVRKPNQTLLDLRVGRRFEGSRGLSIEPLFEIYNLLNENASVSEVETVGTALGRISRNIDGRLVRVSLKVSF